MHKDDFAGFRHVSFKVQVELQDNQKTESSSPPSWSGENALLSHSKQFLQLGSPETLMEGRLKPSELITMPAIVVG